MPSKTVFAQFGGVVILIAAVVLSSRLALWFAGEVADRGIVQVLIGMGIVLLFAYLGHRVGYSKGWQDGVSDLVIKQGKEYKEKTEL